MIERVIFIYRSERENERVNVKKKLIERWIL